MDDIFLATQNNSSACSAAQQPQLKPMHMRAASTTLDPQRAAPAALGATLWHASALWLQRC